MRPALFWWWDDAVEEARNRAMATSRRHRVYGFGDKWAVSEVDE